MSDQRTAMDNSFYHQYLQQHTRITQWIQNMHQNIPRHRHNFLDYQNHAYHPSNTYSNNDHQYQHQPVSQQGNYIPQQRHHDQHQRQQKPHGNSRHDTLNMNHSTISETNVEDNENDVLEEENENDGSDCEWVLNAEPFLAFRAENAKSEKAPTADDDGDSKSEESIEFLDAILDENFEFVQLDDSGQVQKMYGKPDDIKVGEDYEFEREVRIVSYGDKADAVAETEAHSKAKFYEIYDVTQPIIFPIV